MRAEDAVKKILFWREIDCSLEATVGQSVPQEVRTGSAARYVESCWQSIPRAPSSNPLTYKFHLQESVTSQKRGRERAKRTPKDPSIHKGHLGSGITDGFCFFHFPFSSFAQFSKMNISAAV